MDGWFTGWKRSMNVASHNISLGSGTVPEARTDKEVARKYDIETQIHILHKSLQLFRLTCKWKTFERYIALDRSTT